MGWFGEDTITIEVNKVKNKLTATQVKHIWMELQERKRVFDEVLAQRDEAKRAAELLDGRLAAANLKLKEFGNPGQF